MGAELPRAARIKLYHGEAQYKLNVDETMRFGDFLENAKKATSSTTNLILKYIDDEGDPILLTSDEVNDASCFRMMSHKFRNCLKCFE